MIMLVTSMNSCNLAWCLLLKEGMQILLTQSIFRDDIFACRLQYTSFCCTAVFHNHGVTMLLCTVFCTVTLTWPVVALGHPDGAGTMWLV